MNQRFGRSIRRAGVSAAAIFALSAFAAPALAETTSDLELKVEGTTVAVGSAMKWASFTVANHGPQAAANVAFKIDISGLDKTKVAFELPGGCAPTGDVWDCEYTGTIDSGEAWDNGIKLTRVGASTGAAGNIKISISHPQDETTDNNSKTVDVVLSDKAGVDLAAYPDDIYQTTDKGASRSSTTPVQPGATTFFWADVANWGDVASNEIKMDIKLPTGVTFVGSEPACDYTDGSTSTVCDYTGESGLIEAGKDATFLFEVKVDASVAGPVVLGDGVFTVTDVAATPELARAAAKPQGTNRISTQDIKDLDPSDNSDEFTAYVGKKDAPGQGGGLPVTGTQITTIAGIGGAAVIGGGVLLLMARRRKVNA